MLFPKMMTNVRITHITVLGSLHVQTLMVAFPAHAMKAMRAMESHVMVSYLKLFLCVH